NRSLGVKQIQREQSLHAEWLVKYEPGELKAVGRTDGKVVSTDIVRTAGEPVRLEVTADRTEIAADGTDLSYVKIRLVDAQGVLCPDADRMLRISVQGAGTLAGVDNGHHMNHSPFKGNHVKTSYGLGLAVVKSARNAGSIQVNISADGVTAGAATIFTLAPGDARLTEAATKREKQFRENNQKYSRHLLAKIKNAGNTGTGAAISTGLGQANSAAKGPMIVAPVFKHGSGQHADSVVASRNQKPPTWAEKSARDVVIDESKKLGIGFATEGELPLGLDGLSKDGKIAFEILTGDDVPDRIDNTDRITDFHGAALQLAETLKTKPGQYVVGVFYDPLVGKGTAADEEPLRQQVRDFVAWLKTHAKKN
ncbi:MAG: DUF4982 domain-containing protein, partial [Luteolibacter sp.]